MAVKISGVLKDGTGKPVQNCTIQLKAKRNSTTVVVNTLASENPDEAGRTAWTLSTGSTALFCWWRDSRRHMPGPSPCMKIPDPVR
ncbi:Phage tail fiber protein [Escherichia coli ISC7]|uniref:Phage tail fiber protein n=1 Tax=Escherichia coli ISC7 TaxID=1432555 RepID=W1EU32_ECOLX|nr:Phage tail fiber protein [Escherichia coli ISC7]